MKIKVTLIILLCTNIAADNEETIKAEQIFSHSKLQKLVPRHHVYEYSKSMEAINVDFRNKNSSSQDQVSKPMYYSKAFGVEDLGAESDRSLKKLATLRINSKEPSQSFAVEVSPPGEKVLSRKKKDRMEQAMLALLMAYKMKFTALIPILLGGMWLLVSTTALAGFFFALFAAVLGLKTH